MCEFVATTRGGEPIRAIEERVAVAVGRVARAIDEVLAPLADVASAERRATTYAVGIAEGGAERRANAASTARSSSGSRRAGRAR